MQKINTILLMLFTFITGFGQINNQKSMKDKILFVITSHEEKGNTGEKTGYYLGEVAHPWKVLVNAGYEIDFVSPKGGESPIDGFDLEDPINKEFYENEYYQNKIKNSMKPEEVKPEEYLSIFYAGGHGAVWDFPQNEAIAALATKIYENNGIVAAVCHGPAGLLNIKLSNGKYLIDGKKVNGFTNVEEEAVGLTEVVPFLLEDEMKKRGGIFEAVEPWQPYVVVDQRVITGQNPQSATKVGEAMVEALK